MTSASKTKSNMREKNAAMCLAEDRISNCMKEIHKLKEEKLELTEANLGYRDQVLRFLFLYHKV